jgi:asparagine synthase (glutamine-hydrolysing)
MSGIFGLYQFSGAAVDQEDLDRQSARLKHLGRDRIRSWRAGPIGLGQLMMRTVREDIYDSQPLHKERFSLVADLRLDNREALAEKLAIAGGALAEMADSAVLLAAFEKWGADCVDHLIGDFAFAVWDDAQKTLTLARDHLGQRHVFYHGGEGFLAFATEIKGLWARPRVPRVLVEDRIAKRLVRFAALESEPGATMFEGIKAVPGGTVLVVDAAGAITMRRYWEPHAAPEHINRDETYYVDTYRKLLTEAVACRLRRATAPAGLFMGGGFDTSSICALAGPVAAETGHKFVVVSSVMPEDYRGTIHHARKWVAMCRRHMPNLDVRYVTRDGLDIFTGMEAGFLYGDGPHGPNRYVRDAVLKEVAAAGGRIVMDGYGGDYTVNPRGYDALARMLAKGRFATFAREFLAARRHLRLDAARTFKRHVLPYLLPHSYLSRTIRRAHGLASHGPTMPVARAIAEASAGPPRDWGYLPVPAERMLRVLRYMQDMAAMGTSIPAAAHGLEFTQPFHDKRIVEFALAIPESLHFKNGRTRHLARTALADLLPPEYQDRPPGNDGLSPDFLAMAKRVEPRLLAEIDRLEKSARLKKLFDFARMRAMLTRRTIDQHNSGGELVTRQAAHAFLQARYIEWFYRDNA